MDAAPSLHPSDQTLTEFGHGKLDERATEAIHEHLMECSDCRKRISAITADFFLQRGHDDQKPLAADTLPPELLNHPDYQIKKELGRGGMGMVYLAHNTLMGRDEVLKIMHRRILERPGVLDRFLREIRAVARLRHRNIVTAYHAARLGDGIVFAMEYVEGLDLSRMVKTKGPMPIAHACNFIYQAALGLQHAHEEGLVHRDIKPGNLMLERKGDKATVKVLDFGLAKATREQKVDRSLTLEGHALGTPDYIAPEQILDATSADIRADIYSLGATLYFLLTGRPPFRASSLYDVYQAHISRDAEPLNRVRPEVSAELAALVAKMLAKDPSQRFQTPGEVALALTPFFKKGSSPDRGPMPDVSQSDTTQAAPGAAAAPVEDTRATEPSLDEPGWQSLAGLQEPEPPTEAEPAAELPPPNRTPALLAATAAVFGLIALAAIVIAIRARYGAPTITVAEEPQVESGNIEIHVLDGPGPAATPELVSPPQPGSVPKPEIAPARPAQDAARSTGLVSTEIKEPAPASESSRGSPSPALPAVRLPAGPPGSPIRFLGYGGLSSRSELARVARYTNLLFVDYPDSEDLLRAARREGLSVVLEFGTEWKRYDPRRRLELLAPIINRDREVIRAVCLTNAYARGKDGGPQDLAAFGRALKRKFPGLEFWVSFVDKIPGKNNLGIPDEIDTIVVSDFLTTSADEARREADEVLPGWLRRAKGRPLVWRWTSAGAAPPGLVPQTQPGTLRACLEVARRYPLAGLIFDVYDDIAAKPVLLQEIQQIASETGFGPA
jgi:serine/threonine protein kinase